MVDERDDLKPERLDRALVTRGLLPSRSAAQAAIAAGGVFIDGRPATQASQLVAPHAVLTAGPAHPYVSRGGLKLAHALASFHLSVQGRACLDLGASTGGFTEVLLAAGAATVTAVDVGHGQFHPRLRDDPRVRLMEGRDARSLTRADLPVPPGLIVVDASFIGLEKLLPAPLSLAAPAADLVALFKPQFQVGPGKVGKGGIVTDRAAARAAEAAFTDWLAARGWPVEAVIDSPIAGGDGNAERLVRARRSGRHQ